MLSGEVFHMRNTFKESESVRERYYNASTGIPGVAVDFELELGNR